MSTAAVGRQRSIADAILAAIVIVAGIAVVIYASGMKRLASGEMGPGLFPTLIGGLLVLFGVVLLLQFWRGKAPTEDVDLVAQNAVEGDVDQAELGAGGTYEIENESTGRLLLNGIVVVAGIVAYLLLADSLGFIPTLFLILTAIMLVLKEVWWKALVFAGVVTAILYLGFEKGLLVQLPNGILGF